MGQKLKATVRRADGTRTSGRRRERYASSRRGWGIRRPTKGQRPSIAGPQGTCTCGDRAARPECLCRDPGFGRVAGAPRGAGRKPGSLSAPGAVLATVAREPREGGSIAAGRACGNGGAEISRLARPPRPTLGTPDPRGRGTWDVVPTRPSLPSPLPAPVVFRAGRPGVPGGPGSAPPAPRRGRCSCRSRARGPGGSRPGAGSRGSRATPPRRGRLGGVKMAAAARGSGPRSSRAPLTAAPAGRGCVPAGVGQDGRGRQPTPPPGRGGRSGRRCGHPRHCPGGARRRLVRQRSGAGGTPEADPQSVHLGADPHQGKAGREQRGRREEAAGEGDRGRPGAGSAPADPRSVRR